MSQSIPGKVALVTGAARGQGRAHAVRLSAEGADIIVEGGRGGSIVRIGSAAGINVQSFMIHYTASKHAVVGMARAFAAGLGRHNIRVNSLNPGAVATPMGTGRMRDALRSAADSYPHLRGLHKPLLPEGVAQPEDIADAVAWLVSEGSRLVTASQVSVDIGVGYV
ncbi:SDR family oxidoreductase [Mycobacterium sp. THU-M104]|uniref:SDR family oxidoreductase n=1 Tax=Mycobacterium sp. THU-M104 TaxID=3410515 RepID=UPI003B9CA642